MPEYILRPRQHAYKSGYDYSDANHKTAAAYDNDMNTYWYNTGYNVSYPLKMFHDFDFSAIPSDEAIVSAAYRLKYSMPDGIMVKSASQIGYSEPVSSTGLIEKLQNFAPSADATTASVPLNKTLTYLKNNLDALKSGSAKLGFYTKPVSLGDQLKLYDIALVITTEITRISNLYLGGTQIKEAYLGSRKLNGIYLGSKQLL